MEYKAEFAITLPEDLLDALGIDEDTLFEAYYDDGKIKVRILDEEALEDEFEDDDEDFDGLVLNVVHCDMVFGQQKTQGIETGEIEFGGM